MLFGNIYLIFLPSTPICCTYKQMIFNCFKIYSHDFGVITKLHFIKKEFNFCTSIVKI